MCHDVNDEEEDLEVFNPKEPDRETLKALAIYAEKQASSVAAFDFAASDSYTLSHQIVEHIISVSSAFATNYGYGRDVSFDKVLAVLDKALQGAFVSWMQKLEAGADEDNIQLRTWTVLRAGIPTECGKAINQLDKLILKGLEILNSESIKTEVNH